MRFEYGVFLLNKNIEQLMNYVGTPLRNLRNSLKNIETIKSFVEQSLPNAGTNEIIPNWNYIAKSSKIPSSITSSIP
jgi:hypothetical protein